MAGIGLSVFSISADKYDHLAPSQRPENAKAVKMNPGYGEHLDSLWKRQQLQIIKKLKKSDCSNVSQIEFKALEPEVKETFSETQFATEAESIAEAKLIMNTSTTDEVVNIPVAHKQTVGQWFKDSCNKTKDKVVSYAETGKNFIYDQIIVHPYAAIAGVAIGVAYEARLLSKLAYGIGKTAKRVYYTIAKNKIKSVLITGSTTLGCAGAILILYYYNPKLVEDIIASVDATIFDLEKIVLGAIATKDQIIKHVVSPVCVSAATALGTVATSRLGQYMHGKVTNCKKMQKLINK